VSDHLTIAGQPLAYEAAELIAALVTHLSSVVALEDAQLHQTHVKMTDWWFSMPTTGEEPIGLRTFDGRALAGQINTRWRIWILAHRSLPSGASELLESTAQKLAGFLPPKEMDHVPAPPDRGGGGTSSGGELGIPVSWARKARN
jgi:hypothetical protein